MWWSAEDDDRRLLAELGTALGRLGARVRPPDDFPGLAVAVRRDGPRWASAYVVIDDRRMFAWWRAGGWHSVTDVPGAALRLLEFLTQDLPYSDDVRAGERR
ncbi:hypothetical protein [Actinomadura macrotermitis]|uniref:Uncharacterized protein n=1 Tax=Actinomadura macrotermitis TaxID=2585200 RepID=A0A7K0BZ77_9ACTN|nr:hypothetical protein [Actinomadura macrotermitis]MQY06481.1 hypothetical protein [Actinomadura macrotermitis]